MEADRFFDFIAAGRIAPWLPESHEQNSTVMRSVADAAAAYADGGYFTIVEGIVIPRWFLAPLRERLTGHDLAYAVLRAPLEVCAERRPSIGPGVIERIWREFADLGPVESHALDVRDESPGSVADQLADGLTTRFRLSP
jgi:hypothetical protein